MVTNYRKHIIIVVAWWIMSTQCWNGIAYNVWTNGSFRYWLPKLTTQGECISCNTK